MLITTNAITLSKLKYNDSDLIVKCYTEQTGISSFILKGVAKNKKGKQSKNAYFQSLSQLQLVFNYTNKKSLYYLKAIKPSYIYSTVHSNIFKSAIALFLADILSNVLKEEEKNETLFSYIETTLQWLDNQLYFSNFHLLFLLNLTKYLGFYPDTSNQNFNFFNLYHGKFQSNKSDKYSISGENLTLLKQLLGTNFEAISSIEINSKQRQSFLNMILLYFELHLGRFKTPKSLQILNTVFS